MAAVAQGALCRGYSAHVEARSGRTFCMHLAARFNATAVAVPLAVAVTLQGHARRPQLCVPIREDKLEKLAVSGGSQPHVQAVQQQVTIHSQSVISEEEALAGQQVTEGGVAGWGG